MSSVLLLVFTIGIIPFASGLPVHHHQHAKTAALPCDHASGRGQMDNGSGTCHAVNTIYGT